MKSPKRLRGKRKPGSQQRVVSRRKTCPEVAREIMFLLGAEYASESAFRKATQMIRGIWHDGYEIGCEMQKRKPALFKKIKAIIRGKSANEKGQP